MRDHPEPYSAPANSYPAASDPRAHLRSQILLDPHYTHGPAIRHPRSLLPHPHNAANSLARLPHSVQLAQLPSATPPLRGNTGRSNPGRSFAAAVGRRSTSAAAGGALTVDLRWGGAQQDPTAAAGLDLEEQ